MVKCKSKNVYFQMDIASSTSQDLERMDKIQKILENAGFTVYRVVNNKGYGPNGAAIYNYILNHNIHDSIVFFLCNGVDPSNIREGVQQDSNDGSGYWYSRRALKPYGNVLVMGWFYGACDCVHEGGSCYSSVRASETSGRLYNPKQYMDDNGILYFCERTDYSGEKAAEAFIEVVNNNMEETVPDTDTVNPENSDTEDYSSSTDGSSYDTTKTLAEQTTTEIITNAYYQKIYALKTDENGVFKIPTDVPYAGKYKVNANFAGNKNYEGYTLSSEIENYAGETFEPVILETTVVNKYTDGTTDSNVTGDKGDAEHTLTRTTTNTYTDGAITETKQTITNNDDVTLVNPTITPTDTSQTNTQDSLPTGEMKDPFVTVVALNGNLPNVSHMKHNNKTFEMIDLTKTYTLTKAMYTDVFTRDSKSLQLNNYLESKYTAFECTDDNKYHVLSRERWNVIEESIYYYRTSEDRKKSGIYDPGYPDEIIVDFPNKRTKMGNDGWTSWKGETATYHFCADAQDTNYTCGPTSCSVCTQVLHKYYHEREMQNKIGATSSNGSGPESHKRVLNSLGFTATMYSTNLDVAIEWLKSNKPTVFHYYWHYVAFVAISTDGQKILIANSSTSSHAPLTGWKTLSQVKSKNFYGSTVKVGLDWNISNEEAEQINNFYNSMFNNFFFVFFCFKYKLFIAFVS